MNTLPPNNRPLDQSQLRRLIVSLVADEVGAGRGVSMQAESLGWDEKTSFKEGPGPELDSLETLNAAARVNQFFHLYETGVEDYLLAYPTVGEWAEIVAVAQREKFERITFLTSGSTGKPKRCTHSVERLRQDADFILERLAPTRVVSLVPPHHLYGFIFTVLLPMTANLPVVDARTMSSGKLRASLAAGDLLVATPFLLHNFLRSLPSVPNGVSVLSSTAPLQSETALQLLEAGIECLIEVYGASEIGGIGWRSRTDAPFELFPWWSLSDDGLSVIRVDDEERAVLADRLVRIPSEPRSFTLAGRVDNVVQVGGVNVFPDLVEGILSNVEGVKTCRIRPTHAHDGAQNRLKAFVVPDPDVDISILKDRLTQTSRRELLPPARPVSWTFGVALPVSDIGKGSDWTFC